MYLTTSIIACCYYVSKTVCALHLRLKYRKAIFRYQSSILHLVDQVHPTISPRIHYHPLWRRRFRLLNQDKVDRSASRAKRKCPLWNWWYPNLTKNKQNEQNELSGPFVHNCDTNITIPLMNSRANSATCRPIEIFLLDPLRNQSLTLVSSSKQRWPVPLSYPILM